MPYYDHECERCGYLWEEFYSMNADPPTECPKCKGPAKRVILKCPMTKVALGRNELKQHIKEEEGKIRKQMKTDENLRANIMGETAYENTQNNINKIGEEIKQML